MVGDEHDLAVGYTLEVLAVRALAVTLRGLHELVARDPTVLERDLPPRSRSADPAHATEPLASPSKHQACSGHHAARTCQEMRTHGRNRRILSHDSAFRGKFRIVQHLGTQNVPKRPEACVHGKKTHPRPSNVCFVIKQNIRNIRIP